MGQKKVSISSHGVQNLVSLVLDNHYFSLVQVMHGHWLEAPLIACTQGWS